MGLGVSQGKLYLSLAWDRASTDPEANLRSHSPLNLCVFLCSCSFSNSNCSSSLDSSGPQTVVWRPQGMRAMGRKPGDNPRGSNPPCLGREGVRVSKRGGGEAQSTWSWPFPKPSRLSSSVQMEAQGGLSELFLDASLECLINEEIFHLPSCFQETSLEGIFTSH